MSTPGTRGKSLGAFCPSFRNPECYSQAQGLANIATVYAARGDHTGALRNYHLALGKFELLGSPLNLSLKEGALLAGVLPATGKSYFWSGEKHLAARYFNRALVHYKISVVNLPPHVLRELLDVRDLTEELKDYGLSLQYFQLALQEYENKVGEYHLDKLLTLHNLGSLYRRLRDDEKEIYYCKRVIAALQLEDSGNGQQSNCYHDAF